jgi:hypothetical protein
MVSATALLMVGAMCGEADKGVDARRALDEQNAVRTSPVVLVVPETVVVTAESAIVIEALEEAPRGFSLSDEWQGETALTRIRASFWRRVVRGVESM